MKLRAFDPKLARDALPPQDGDEPTDRLTEAVIGAAIEVHRTLGPGFLESVYEQALGIELELRAIEHKRQAPVSMFYKGHPVGEGRIDLLVQEKLIVELKTVAALTDLHIAQAISYLKATGHKTALLINFNVPVLKDGIKRVSL